MTPKYHNAEWVRQQRWINEEYTKVKQDLLSSPLSELSWNDDAFDAAPCPATVPGGAQRSREPLGEDGFNADHAWDMVVLAARASRYG